MSDSIELYKDRFIEVDLPLQAAAKGHIRLSPTKQAKSINDLSPGEFVQLFFGASYAATALFELLGAQGTNIILNESESQLTVDVVARSENDGLNFLWQPTKGDPHELQSVAKSIKDKADQLIWARDNPEEAKKAKRPVTPGQATEIKSETDEQGKEKTNYLLKSLRRVP